jgi:molecular chaperone DnaK
MKNQLSILNPSGADIMDVPKPIRVLGIDLGTTNSTVSETIWERDKSSSLDIRCLEIDQETQSGLYTHTLIPSAVAIHNGREWIGEGAKRLHVRAPEFGLELTKNLFLECKNDIGSQRTYHKAPEGYRNAEEVSARVLGFIKKAAEAESPLPVSRTVVTVPASFQASQRISTVNAAKTAGIDISGGDLLDEPVAAFLDYVLSHSEDLKGVFPRPQNLVVFDFGGGTCDVAVFRVGASTGNNSLQINPLAVSRYHRLGGGDIDRAILHEALIPQLLEQNQLEPFDLSFEDKKGVIEPSFLGVAEALKTGLCNEISRLQSFGQYSDADKEQVFKKQPGVHSCKVGERILKLSGPILTAAQFEEILEPFLDQDLLYARETEYRLTTSVFAPLQDALDRSHLSAKDIDICLLVGGSSLIPQVVDGLKGFFPQARLLTFADREATQLAVSRGAAAHALALSLYGKSIFQVASPDQISIKTQQGAYELMPKGAPLPFPSDGGWSQTSDLSMPETSPSKPVSMRIEILGGFGEDERTLCATSWEIPPPIKKGDKVRIEYRMDENQVLHFRVSMDERPEASSYAGRLENPFSNVVNPHAKRIKIQQSEEELRTGKIPQAKIPEKVVEIARDYAEIQHTEKAISYLKQALRLKNRADSYILNLLGIYSGEQGDYQSQEKFYLESAASGGGSAPLFNLAHSQYQRKKYKEAQDTIEKSLLIDSNGPRNVLAAQISKSLGDPEAGEVYLNKAFKDFGPLHLLSDWELGWYITATQIRKQTDNHELAKAEKNRRAAQKGSTLVEVGGVLPEISGVIQKI